jgi:hypothetical protein
MRPETGEENAGLSVRAVFGGENECLIHPDDELNYGTCLSTSSQ